MAKTSSHSGAVHQSPGPDVPGPGASLTAKFAVGDEALQAWNRVQVQAVRRSCRMGVEYRVLRLNPEPTGYEPDGSIYATVGPPFWVQAWMLRPVYRGPELGSASRPSEGVVQHQGAAAGSKVQRPQP